MKFTWLLFPGMLLVSAIALSACGDRSESSVVKHDPAADYDSAVVSEGGAQSPAVADPVVAVDAGGDDLEPKPAIEDQQPLKPWKRLDLPPEADLTVDWSKAKDFVGQKIAVEGTIVDSYNSGRACFLNFKKEWRGEFYLAILGSTVDDFPSVPEVYFLNKKVRAIGKVAMYKGRPQLVIASEKHITILP